MDNEQTSSEEKSAVACGEVDSACPRVIRRLLVLLTSAVRVTPV